MYCINQRVRSKNYRKYVYCIKLKKDIAYDECSNCEYKEYKKAKPIKVNAKIKKKSTKLSKLERNRYSVMTNDLEHCYICNQQRCDLHEVFAGSNRKTSMKYGLVIPVCRECHENISNDIKLTKKLHEIGKKVFKQVYRAENFIEVFGKSYI